MTNRGYSAEEPIAAIATALSPAAIGIVRTSGTSCIEKISAVFSRPAALRSAAGNSLVYGWILEPASSERIDEVMLGVYRAPKSFCGEDMIEIFCHGGVSVVKKILHVLLENGFREALPGEFTFRAYINGKADLTKAEAVKEIIESKTVFSGARAARRLHGSVLQEIASIKAELVKSLAHIEVEIEYPEDEETIADSFDKTELLGVQKQLSLLADSWKTEKLYQEGVSVVLCGRPNAGKSSLFNALLKEDRAIVSPTEGTTRDWLESPLDFDGIPVRLFDTAGLRETSDEIEKEGVLRTHDLSHNADIVFYVVDATVGITPSDADFLKGLTAIPLVIVWTKIDAKDALPPPREIALLKNQHTIRGVSSVTKDGISSLAQCIKEILFKNDTHGEKSLGSERQKRAVTEALSRVTHALSVSQSGYALDAVVQDIEDALAALGEVTGEVTPDDILDSVFSQFCVGK